MDFEYKEILNRIEIIGKLKILDELISELCQNRTILQIELEKKGKKENDNKTTKTRTKTTKKI